MRALHESGVHWIGEVPKTWNLGKVSYIFNEIGSGTTPKSGNPEYYEEGTINWLNTGDLNDSVILKTSKKITNKAFKEHSVLKMYESGSIVIALYGATIGKVGILGISTTCNQACCIINNSERMLNNFLFYILLTCRKHLISLAYGGGQPNISQDIIKNLRIPIPPLTEQSVITNYLDHKIKIIDKLIADKEKLVTLLQEQRQATINETVTKGLDPNAKMKDSGIKWLGEIPEDWEVKKLKFVASFELSSVNRNESDEEISVAICHYPYAYKNEKVNKSTILDRGTCTAEQLEKFGLKEGQIIITKDSESADDIGIPTYVEENIENAVCGYHLGIINVNNENILPEFLFRFCQSGFVSSLYEASVNGITRYGLGKPLVENLKILIPPKEYQHEIISTINGTLLAINNSITGILEQIDNLKSYRQSLISEAVTGKIDLRNWEALVIEQETQDHS